MFKYLNISILSLMLSFAVSAQNKPSYKILCPDNNFQPYGMYVGFGGSITSAKTETQYLISSVNNTTAYQMTIDSKGKLGYSADLGGLFVFRSSFVRMLDFGFSYRAFSGSENMRGVRVPESDLSFPDQLLFQGSFKYHRASFKVNAQSVFPLGYRSFIHFGPGLTIDETIAQKSDYELEHLNFETEIPDKPSSNAINIKFGLAVKVTGGKFIDVYSQIPVYSLAKGKGFDTSEDIFNSSYSNSIVGVRLLIVKGTPDRICPALSPNRGGSRLPKKRLKSDFFSW